MRTPGNTGRDVDDPYRPEIEHFGNCSVCGALVDMRDLSALLDHIPGQEIELLEGPIEPDTAALKSPSTEAVLLHGSNVATFASLLR